MIQKKSLRKPNKEKWKIAKSFFNELGFKPTIEKLVDLTAKLYLEDDNLAVGYSGGKDSSAVYN